MYAQKLEGDSWIGEQMDIGKIDKMSGTVLRSLHYISEIVDSHHARSAARSTI
jgi:hypothetical protein